jgi:putative ABC transport system substrate-binding protein
MNNRRKLLIAFGSSTLPVALASFAQQPGRVWRVGVLVLGGKSTAQDPESIGAFALGLRELGHVEGKTLLLEWRFADGDSKRLPELAATLVNWKPDVLVGVASNPAAALQKASSTIPIVMSTSADPVASRWVRSLAHPGGNVTGVFTLQGDLGLKRLEMLRAMVPKLSRVAMLVNGTIATSMRAAETAIAASDRLGFRIVAVKADTPQEINGAFARIREQKADAVSVVPSSLFIQQESQIAALAAQYRLPVMTPSKSFVDAGCLMSYGSDLATIYRRLSGYVDKILKGAKPADLPVEQPTKFELVINRKVAKALGLSIPQSLLISADKIIE